MKCKYSVLERFLKYVTFDTQAKDAAGKTPSTDTQFALANELVKELKALGLKDAAVDEHCYVTATLPSNMGDKKVPAIGFVAHIDTALEVTGKDVKPRVVENYDGGDIVLDKEGKYVLSPKNFPELPEHKGKDLVVTDGTTLLGADNKAGIAEIMGALDELVKHPELPHGTVKVAFTPDEEIGHLAALLDIKKFGADFAYTLDGGPVGEYAYENFNAARAKIKIHGLSVHPGKSKDKMINASLVGVEFANMMPPAETPAHTEKYEGFFHLTRFDGLVNETKLDYILRDHDAKKLERRKQTVRDAVEWLKKKYGEDRIELEITDQYFNMGEHMKEMHIVENAVEAIKQIGAEPFKIAMRGGTDGAALTLRGLPCPNIFTGGYNYHGQYEYIPVCAMEKGVEFVLKILELYAKK